MEFCKSYNCHSDLILESGRVVTLQRLVQSRTYDHFIMGQPNQESNDQDLEQFIHSLSNPREPNRRPYLIAPQRTNYFHAPGDRKVGRFGEPEYLPAIRCIGWFKAFGPARDLAKDYSELTILWFQKEYGIDDAIAAKIQGIDWNAHATDYEYND